MGAPVRGTFYKSEPLVAASLAGTPPNWSIHPKGNLANHERPQTRFRSRLVVPPRPGTGPDSRVSVVAPAGTVTLPSPPAVAQAGATALPSPPAIALAGVVVLPRRGSSGRRAANAFPACNTAAALAGIHPAPTTYPPAQGSQPEASASDQASGSHPGPRMGGVHDRNPHLRLDHWHRGADHPRGRPARRTTRHRRAVGRLGRARKTHRTAAWRTRYRGHRGTAHGQHDAAVQAPLRKVRHDLAAPRLLDRCSRTRQGEVERRLRLGRGAAADSDHRSQHRDQDRRLSRGRFPRGGRGRGCGGRHRDLPGEGHQRQGRPPGAAGGVPEHQREDGPRLRPDAQVRPDRRHRPHDAPTRGDREGREEGSESIDPDQSHLLLETEHGGSPYPGAGLRDRLR